MGGNILLENQKIVDDILKYIIKIHPNDILITESSLLALLIKEKEFIRDSFCHFNVVITPKQFSFLDMK